MSAVIRMTLIALAIVLGLVAALPWLAEPALRLGLRLAGLDTVQFDRLRLGWGEIELEELAIGAPDHQLARLRVVYRLPDLLEGRLERIEIEGLVVRARLRDGQVELVGFPAAPEPAADERTSGLPPLPRADAIVVRDARLDVATPLGRLQLPLSADLRQTGERMRFMVSVDDGRLASGDGAIRADLDASGSLPLAGPVAIGDLAAHGTLALAADGVALDDLAEGIDAAGTLDFDLASGHLQAESSDLELSVADLGPRLASLEGPLPLPWRARVGEGAPARLEATIEPGEVRVELDGALALATAGPQAEATVDLALVLDGTAVRRVAPSVARVTLRDVRWQGKSLDEGRIELAAEGSPDALHGTLDLDLSGAGWSTPDLDVTGASLRHRLDWTLAHEMLTVEPRETGALHVDRLAWGQDVQAGPVRLRLEASDRPVLEVGFDQSAPSSWRQHSRAVIEAFELRLATPAPLRLQAETGVLTADLAGDAHGLLRAEIGLAAGRLRAPEHALTFDRIAAAAILTGTGLVDDQTIPVTVGRISHGGKPAWFAPLALDGELRPGADRLTFEATLRRIDGGLALTLRGDHQRAAGSGRATVELAPVTFSPSGLQPDDLAPILAGLVTETSGQVALSGDLVWTTDSLDTALDLLIEELALSAGPARLEQINGVIRLDRLWPPSTPPGQQLAIGLLDLGLPLTEGVLTFELTPDQRLVVGRLDWRFAGGTVRAAPFSVGSDLASLNVALRAEHLDLARLFELARLEGLTGEGTLHGVLPVRLAGGAAIIEGGELAAAGAGVLHYRADTAPAALQAGDESVDLLLQALENFHYEALRITLDGRTDAAMDIGLHLSGANPDLYGGYPIEFNLDLEGELGNILRQGVASYQIPDRIRERMQHFGR